MSNKILDIYKSILSFSGMQIDEDGTIFGQLMQSNPNTRSQVFIGNEPLVFPDDRQFKDINQKKIYFHPFCENFVRGESEVIEVLRERIMVRLNFVTAMTMGHLLRLLGSPQLHRRLNEEQKDLLKVVSTADETTHKEWSKLMPRLIKNHHDSAYVKLYLKHTGTWEGQPYSRVGIVTFPFYQDLVNGKYEGKIRKKDEQVFKKVLEFVFPGIDKTESYNYGTRTRVAPYFDALMMTASNVAARLNEMNSIYNEYIDDADEMVFDTDWALYFQDLDNLRPDISSMPELKGNAGKTSVSDKRHPPQEEVHKPLPEPATVSMPRPEQIYQPPVPAQPQQQAAVQQPIYGTIAPVNTPAVRENEGKLNFNDMLRANPMMTQIHNPLAPPQFPPDVMAYVQQYGQFPPGFNPQMVGMRQQGAMAQTVPTWAQSRPAIPMQGMPYQQPGYGPAPMMQPQYQQPQLQAPPPGFQYVANPQNGQPMMVPLQPMMQPQFQPQYQQPMQQPVGQMPPGWNWNR